MTDTNDRIGRALAAARDWWDSRDSDEGGQAALESMSNFVDGVLWADENPAPRTITPDQREELMYKLVGIEMMFMGEDVDMILDFLGIKVEEEW